MRKDLFIKKIPSYLENVDICKVKLPTEKIFAALACKEKEYFIVLNINKSLKQQCSSIIHELLHYHNKDLVNHKNIDEIENNTHRLTKYYRKRIPICIKKYIMQKIRHSAEYDSKTWEKLTHAGKLKESKHNSTLVEYQTP